MPEQTKLRSAREICSALFPGHAILSWQEAERAIEQATREALEAAILEIDLAGGDNAEYHMEAIRSLLPQPTGEKSWPC